MVNHPVQHRTLSTRRSSRRPENKVPQQDSQIVPVRPSCSDGTVDERPGDLSGAINFPVVMQRKRIHNFCMVKNQSENGILRLARAMQR